MPMPEKVNLTDKFALFSEHWSPKIVGTVDDYDVKLVKVKGDFVWHSHTDEDEMFLVIDGKLDMHFRDGNVTLNAGEFIVVPRGMEHKPYASRECRILILERQGVVNTGDAQPSDLTAGVGERL